MESASLVHADAVDKVYPGEVQALQGLSFSMQDGEFISIVGPSGCGKSTLLKLLAGLEEPSSGTILVRRRTPIQARRRGLDMALVFQTPNLLPWRSVLQNVVLPMDIGGRSDSGAYDEARALLAKVGLADFTGAYPHQLSGGMRMRVSLARALITHPGLLLLDEPFGALDELTRQSLNEELLRLWEEKGWGAVFITHNVAEALFLSTRVLVMSSRPGRFVAEFAIPFAFPRQRGLRTDPEFMRFYREVSDCLQEGNP